MVITFQYLYILLATLILTVVTIGVESNAFKNKFSERTSHFIRNVLLTLIVFGIVYLCYLNFPASLTLLVIITGFIALIDLLFFARRRRVRVGIPNSIVENARGFFPVLLVVWVIRSFIIQPYHVPSGSLEPTIVPGDLILVKQYPYGLRFPIFNLKMVNTGEPKRGDIVLFYNPVNPQIVFIKRLIGMPGDHIAYRNKVLYVNGVEAKQTLIGPAQDREPGRDPIAVNQIQENLSGVVHDIFVRADGGGETQDYDFVVPQGQYFMMGDNRDDSDDGRTGFGSGVLTFVPEQNLIGQGFFQVFSWDADKHSLRWDRMFQRIH